MRFLCYPDARKIITVASKIASVIASEFVGAAKGKLWAAGGVAAFAHGREVVALWA